MLESLSPALAYFIGKNDDDENEDIDKFKFVCSQERLVHFWLSRHIKLEYV